MRIEAGEGDGGDPGAGLPPQGVPVRVAKGSDPSGRRAVAVLVAVLLVGGLAAGALALLGGRERSPSARLAAARAAVEDADSFRFTVRTSRRPPGLSNVTSLTAERGRSIDGRRHVALVSNVSAYEAILDTDGTLYSRWATGTLDLDEGVPWLATAAIADGDLLDDIAGRAEVGRAFAETTADARIQFAVDAATVEVAALLYLTGPGPVLDGPGAVNLTGGSLRGTHVDPGALLAAIEEWGTPVGAEGDTLTATLRAPDDAVEAFGRPLPEGRVEVDLGPGDLPRAARLTVAAEGAVETGLTFSDWDDPMVVTAPSGDGIDRTPWLDEDGIRSIDVAPLVPPGVLDGDRLRVQSTQTKTMTGFCDILLLTSQSPPQVLPRRYGDPPAEGDGLGDGVQWLHETSLDCALVTDATPFAPGGPGGHPSRRSAGGMAQVLVGGTVVEIGTRVDGTELDRLAASLAPVDLDALVTAAAEMPEGWTLAEELG